MQDASLWEGGTNAYTVPLMRCKTIFMQYPVLKRVYCLIELPYPLLYLLIHIVSFDYIYTSDIMRLNLKVQLSD
jgi:hypothetical protein